MKRLFILLILCAFPLSTFAAEPITRRDGFLMLWQSIRRPAEPAKGLFSDIPEEARGSLEIDFARSRGIIDEAEAFSPDSPLMLHDALIWLLRTRNVTDDPKEVNAETLADLLATYPVAHVNENLGRGETVTEESLQRLMFLLDSQLVTQEHEVSLYGEQFHGDGTAFGETFDMHALTAAHRSFPHNTLVKVTNVRNGKSVVVRINDRGPYVKGRDMDLSVASFTSIEDRSKGKFMATFERLGDSRLVDRCGERSPRRQRIYRSIYLTEGIPRAFQLGKTLTLSSKNSFVVRGVRYPDGSFNRFQDFILEGESFEFKPSVEGEYVFTLGTIDGHIQEMNMNVATCGE